MQWELVGRMKVKINKKLCDNCGKCIEVCPRGVFGWHNGQVVVKDESACVGCMACVANCPKNAIEVEE